MLVPFLFMVFKASDNVVLVADGIEGMLEELMFLNELLVMEYGPIYWANFFIVG